jgi:hypothetical protein
MIRSENFPLTFYLKPDFSSILNLSLNLVFQLFILTFPLHFSNFLSNTGDALIPLTPLTIGRVNMWSRENLNAISNNEWVFLSQWLTFVPLPGRAHPRCKLLDIEEEPSPYKLSNINGYE